MPAAKVKCKRCGKCCIYVDVRGGTRVGIFCRYLVSDSKEFHTCTRWHKHLGVHIGMGYYCGLRCDSDFDFDGCPYNTDKPMLY